MTKIRARNEWIHVELIPLAEESGLVLQPKGPPFRAGKVLSVGDKAKGVSEGDVVVFPKEHLTLHKSGRRLAYHLAGEDASFMVKWYDCLFVLEPGQSIEVEGFSFP